METQNGILTVISGFSGSGKGTIMRRLLEKYPGQYALSISATTRSPREGEEDGREYFFKTQEQFEQMIADGALLEYAKYVDHYYGTPRHYVEEQLSAGRDVILEIEVQGALEIKKQFPDTVLLFVTAPSVEELRERLTGRGTEDPAVVHARLCRALEESQSMDAYDYLVVNDEPESCVDQVHCILQNEHAKSCRSQAFIHRIRTELEAYVKGEQA
jgi:guanylate kinase